MGSCHATWFILLSFHHKKSRNIFSQLINVESRWPKQLIKKVWMDISPSVDWGQTSVSARYLAEYSGSLCPCCDVTCDRVMSASVTLIGHTPTVTIHNRHPPPLCVSHDYCFHLIKYYNHNPFPIGPRHPDTSPILMILLVSDTPRHPAMKGPGGQCQRWPQ